MLLLFLNNNFFSSDKIKFSHSVVQRTLVEPHDELLLLVAYLHIFHNADDPKSLKFSECDVYQKEGLICMRFKPHLIYIIGHY